MPKYIKSSTQFSRWIVFTCTFEPSNSALYVEPPLVSWFLYRGARSCHGSDVRQSHSLTNQSIPTYRDMRIVQVIRQARYFLREIQSQCDQVKEKKNASNISLDFQMICMWSHIVQNVDILYQNVSDTEINWESRISL